MKNETRQRVDNLSMKTVMIVLTAIGLVAVPVLWTSGHLTSAIAVSLLVAMLVLEAALVDLPGLTYTQLEKLWGKKKRGDDSPEPDSPPSKG